MKKKIFLYDWKTMLLICSTWGVIVFPLAFLTMFYYLVFFLISNFLFGGMNIYFQGILAGGTGAVWGYFVPKGIDKQEQIAKEISKYSPQKYYGLLKKRANVGFVFLILDIIFIIGIKVLNLY